METSASPQRAQNPYRLPEHVVPVRYELRLEPDLSRFTFQGRETITVEVREATDEILLNAADLQVSEAVIENEVGLSQRGTIELEEATERCRIRFPTKVAPGPWRLHLTFQGFLNDKLRGFYRSTYKDAQGTTHVLAATQFEPTDARRAFPCWDEPSFKAVFSVTLVIDPALTAVSNTGVLSERLESSRKVVQFRDTIRMSTYLVAFVVGRIEATEPVMVGKTPLRVWAVPGKRHLSGFALQAAAVSLRFFEDYYGLPYPGDKLDLLAIPDFASGAMENLGAITFRETALLVDQQRATHGELERVADVVAHENAHMWFGDLVTMSWWNGLWLNEAFATFMEMLAVDAWKPEWRRWTSFGVSRAAAMTVDGLHSTRPIEYPVQAPHDAEAMFDVLTYEKGASVLRMIEQHLGPEVFRDGVREYLRRHAYGNADTGDLWTALGQAAKQPVPAVLEPWIFSPGYPLVTVRVEGTERGDRLVLSQQRFTYLPSPPADLKPGGPQQSGGAGQRWQIPVRIRVIEKGQSSVQRILLSEDSLQVDLPPGFEAVVVNEGGHGFYRVRYAPDLLDRLLRLLEQDQASLQPIERFNLVNDAWAAAVAGLVPLPEYLDLTARFKAERDKNVWEILLHAFYALHRLLQPTDRPAFEALVRDRLSSAFTDLGWNPRPGEDELTKQLRGELIRTLGTIGNDRAVQERAAELYLRYAAADRFDATGRQDQLDPNILPALITTLAHTGDEARYHEFLQRFHSAPTPQEERRYLYALAAFQQPGLLEQTLTRTINGEIRTQDGPFLVRSVLMNVSGRELAWSFVKREWDTMARLFPKNGLRRMCEGVIGLTTPELEQDVRRFFTERKIDLGGKTLEQYLEQLHIGVVLRQRDGKVLSDYLRSFASSSPELHPQS